MKAIRFFLLTLIETEVYLEIAIAVGAQQSQSDSKGSDGGSASPSQSIILAGHTGTGLASGITSQ